MKKTVYFVSQIILLFTVLVIFSPALSAQAESSATSFNLQETGSEGSISGHVYQADGVTPVEGATVLAWNDTGYGDDLTGADGSYSIDGLTSGDYTVGVQAEGYLQQQYDSPVSVTAPDDTPDINFSLDALGSISGHVYQSDGVTPIEGAQVLAWNDYHGNSGLTSSDGSYTITLLPSGDYEVQVTANGYLTENHYEAVTVSAPDNTPDIDFVLSTGGSISGYVYEDDGSTPVAGAMVEAGDAATQSSGQDITGADGRYSITGLPSGDYEVQVTANGYPVHVYDSPVSVTPPDDTSGINFYLRVNGSISGRVLTADGVTPMDGAWVSAWDENTGFSGGDETNDGYYTITGLPTGDYEVTAAAAGYRTEVFNGPVSVTAPYDTPRINFNLYLVGSISGHVYDADGVTPLEGAVVCARDENTGFSGSDMTDNNGLYAITGLPSGRYEVKAESDGYLTKLYSSLVSVTAPDDTSGINFSLDVVGSVSGHVYEADGITPVEDAAVCVWNDYHGSSNHTGPDGSYNVTGLPTGNYHVRVTASGYRTEDYPESVNITAPNDTPGIDFTLEFTGSISGYVYQADGITPVAGAMVEAWNAATNSYGMDITDTDGSYTVTGLPTGNYQVRVTAIGYRTEDYPESVSVTAPQDTPGIDFRMGYKPGDANDDGDINAADVTSIIRMILALDDEHPNADANQDGVVNVNDVTQVVRTILGLD
ncbi:MAG: carboxypeptidase regulatory-like domain-containing protein [Dehalococcoidales bacterium]|nr:carboxypeptidase regulatory-like domain-containing protein [Dehalococcoidales bacterium]